MAPKPTKQLNAPPQQQATQVPETTDLVKAQSAANALAATRVPDWLAKEMGERSPQGLELVDREDIILPRIVLAQSLHREVKDKIVEEGDIFDNLTKLILAKRGEKLRVIPIVLGKSRMFFEDMEKGGGILCRADDALTARPGGCGKDAGDLLTADCGKCIHKEWDATADESKPSCNLFYNIVVLLPDHDYTASVLSMKSTQIKVAKRLLSIAKQVNADFWSRSIDIWSVPQKNGKFDFQNFDFSVVGWVSEQEFQLGSQFYKSMEGKTVQPDISDLENPEPGSNDGDEFPPTEEPSAPSAQTVDAAPPPPAPKATPPTPPAAKNGAGPKQDDIAF